MNETLDEDFLEEKPIVLTDDEIFRQIWLAPRRVFTFINQQKYDKYVTMLMVLAGIANALSRAESKNMGDRHSLTLIIIISIVVGALFGWLSYYIFAALVSWTGRWVGASGKTSDIMRVLVFASIPSVVALIFIIVRIMVHGDGNFSSDGLEGASTAQNIIIYATVFCETVLAIWSLVLAVVGISVVQKLSIGNAILNTILPVFVIVIPIVILFLLIDLFGNG